jgi:tetratricopeptide (TPR) repeat protein
MVMRRLAIVLLSLVAATLAGSSPGSPQDHSTHAIRSPRAATLMPGFGRVHHPIATRSPDAQAFFDQGLALVYGFNHEEAIRSFTQASALDPQALMPYWGVAYALGPNINMDVDAEAERRAYDARQQALAHVDGAPPHERAYVEALAHRYSNAPDADLHALAVSYAAAMKELTERYPDDLDAATLYAESLMDLRPWRLWTPDGEPEPGTEEVVTVLESVLERQPDHLGANHYYIHAVEASRQPGRALPSARRLETLAPASGHLVHMPAHTYIRTGAYADAARSNEAAIAADEAYVAATGARGLYPTMYYAHNWQFLATARAMEGRAHDAIAAADRAAAVIRPALGSMPMLEAAGTMPTLMRVRFHRWQEVLVAPAPDPRYPIQTAIDHYARGAAYAATGAIDQAVEERARLEESRRRISSQAMFTTTATGALVLELAGDVLDARIAEARGEKERAIALWQKAVAKEDTVPYDEPPVWIYPSRERLGAALLRAGRPGEAEQVFRDDLARNPNNGRSLFGLWHALEAQHKTADAQAVKAQFDEAWKQADTPLILRDF